MLRACQNIGGYIRLEYRGIEQRTLVPSYPSLRSIRTSCYFNFINSRAVPILTSWGVLRPGDHLGVTLRDNSRMSYWGTISAGHVCYGGCDVIFDLTPTATFRATTSPLTHPLSFHDMGEHNGGRRAALELVVWRELGTAWSRLLSRCHLLGTSP